MNWKYIRNFKKEEFECKCGCGLNNIDFELVNMLDNARWLAKLPFVINSPCRCQEYNKKVGGVENSSHCKGLAVDIACDNVFNRFNIVSSLLEVGFKRILIYKTFIHVDIDLDKSYPIIELK